MFSYPTLLAIAPTLPSETHMFKSTAYVDFALEQGERLLIALKAVFDDLLFAVSHIINAITYLDSSHITRRQLDGPVHFCKRSLSETIHRSSAVCQSMSCNGDLAHRSKN